jgi:hypothetical protein
MLRAIRVAGLRDNELQRLVALHQYANCRALVTAERAEEAIALARVLLGENRLPEIVTGMKWTLGSALLLARRYGEAHAVFLETLLPARPAGAGTPIALASAAWAALMTNDPALREEADHLSREALDAAPDDPHVTRTRGTVLLRLGRTEEAAALLAEATRRREGRRGRAYGAAALAIVAARSADRAAAEARLEQAKSLWSECDLLPWAEEEARRAT